ncbi:right-handed parallel beta-helix repeat-containing protein [Halobacterium yunchengense]|uniref:right-handed parallel beta-helix repeat-containing protein n=1 Tax=Halobacterium yunchengense TaxID=3108497 RepID=UPI003008A06B
MANSHPDRDDVQDEPTSGDDTQAPPTGDDAHAQDGPTGEEDAQAAPTSLSRRSFAKALGAAAVFGAGSSVVGSASAVSDLDAALSPDGEVTLDPGEYDWDGSGFDIGSGDALVGGGEPGDVVLNLEGGTMDGGVEGRLENVVVRGANPESKSGLDVHPGATVDGFVWPEGGQQSEDRAMYSPNGGDERLTIRNSAWAWMANNGAYIDKPATTMENCAAVNNNIANVRVGHSDGTSEDETTYIRNTLVAVTEEVASDDTNSANARGIRLREPGNLVIENCWFVYLDVPGTADLVELHDGAAGSTVTIRDCVFYNDSDGDLVRDKSGGEMDVTIENCTVAGSGSTNVEPDYEGSGVEEVDEVSVPLPSEVTGYAAADEIEGVGEGVGPWDGEASAPSSSGDDELDHTIVLHASPDNDAAGDVTFTVDGDVEFAAEAEPDTDTIVENDDGTVTATSVALEPDALDSYHYAGGVVDYSVPEGVTVDVAVDGNTTTFGELVGDDQQSDDGGDASGSTDTLEVVSNQAGDLDYEFVVDGSVELHETSEQITAGHGDSIEESGDGTVTVTGFTGNDGYGDAYLVDGEVVSFTWQPEDYDFEVRWNGEVVDPTALTEDASSDDGSSDDGSSDADSSGDGSSDADSSDDGSSDGSSDDGSSDGSSDGSADDGSSDDGSSGDGGTDELPHLVTVDGGDAYDVTAYTFTVSGDVARDADLSSTTEDGSTWDRVEDFARDGKVIGLVGSGVDAFRFSGGVTELTVEGDATVTVERDA